MPVCEKGVGKQRTAHLQNRVLRHHLALLRRLLALPPEQLRIRLYQHRCYAAECGSSERRRPRSQRRFCHTALGTMYLFVFR